MMSNLYIRLIEVGRKQGNSTSLDLKFDIKQRRNAGGDMSFLICGPRPGGRFDQFCKFLPKMVGFLPNFGDKPPDFQGRSFESQQKYSLTLL
jgi:hypothetical protein